MNTNTYMTNCCGVSFVYETDLCSRCLEHADVAEEEDCCESRANGFRCTCVEPNSRYSQQAEDDGRGDYERENYLDGKEEERKMGESYDKQ